MCGAGDGVAASLVNSTAMKNPRSISFIPPADYADVERVDLAIFEATSPPRLDRTINLGKPPIGTDGRCTATINVQPVKPFGFYFGVAYSIAGTVTSDPSEPSTPPWERAPGPPTALTFGA